ncbi:MAG TPA: NAD-dependent epimerase/dehydratase family protein [Candidatus Tumulicola sp.]|nr:NAD-dependent epimerase/dehydratase family protein [Candidatus Tumulicola sp.]
MRILIIGGTKFLGPHVVEAARRRGHALTLFNRGRSSGAAIDGVTGVAGDRATDIDKVSGQRWDAVIDTCGFVPRVVRLSLDALRARTKRYAFISSISAYAEPFGGNFDEREPVAMLADPAVEEVTNETYGALKALCEEEVRALMGDGALIVRPGLICGPLDPTDRFTYWPHRFAQGGDVLVPGVPEKPISIIDVRDLAEWIVHATENALDGTFNVSGEYGRATMGDVVSACLAASAAQARPVWVAESFLIERNVAPWTELPLWIPGEEDSLLRASSARAVAAGLRRRDVGETVRATLAWTKERGLDRKLNAGLTRERETELLAEWGKNRG